MAFSDSLLGLLIFLGLTLVSFLVFLIKEKIRPSKPNAGKGSDSREFGFSHSMIQFLELDFKKCQYNRRFDR